MIYTFENNGVNTKIDAVGIEINLTTVTLLFLSKSKAIRIHKELQFLDIPSYITDGYLVGLMINRNYFKETRV